MAKLTVPHDAGWHDLGRAAASHCRHNPDDYPEVGNKEVVAIIREWMADNKAHARRLVIGDLDPLLMLLAEAANHYLNRQYRSDSWCRKGEETTPKAGTEGAELVAEQLGIRMLDVITHRGKRLGDMPAKDMAEAANDNREA